MNRILCVALLGVLGGARATAAQTVRAGAKAGGSFTTLVGPGTGVPPRISPLLGAMGGLYRSFTLSPAGRWALQPELLYS